VQKESSTPLFNPGVGVAEPSAGVVKHRPAHKRAADGGGSGGGDGSSDGSSDCSSDGGSDSSSDGSSPPASSCSVEAADVVNWEADGEHDDGLWGEAATADLSDELVDAAAFGVFLQEWAL
jgi:hypothetical protein